MKMRQKIRQRWLARLLALLVALLLALASGTTLAGTQARAGDAEGPRKRDWQQRYESVLSRAAQVEVRIAASRKAIRKARQRDRLKGQHRKEILSELESAQREREAIRELLEAFPERARQAGVPPGWLREVEQRRAGAS